MIKIPLWKMEMVIVWVIIMIYNYLNCILDHDHDLQNAVHRLHGHVQGAIHQDNVVRHIPKINIINNMIQVPFNLNFSTPQLIIVPYNIKLQYFLLVFYRNPNDFFFFNYLICNFFTQDCLVLPKDQIKFNSFLSWLL